MSASLARVTGTVLSVPEPFRGTSSVTGKPFVMESVKVLVANSDVTTVGFSRDETARIRGLHDVLGFKVGDVFDALVEVEIYRNEPQFRLQKQWEPEGWEIESVLEAHTASSSA